MIGTYLDVKSLLAVTYSSIRWARSVSHRLPTIGPGSQLLSVVWSSISLQTRRHPGICSSLTTIYWSREALSIALDCFCFSYCVQWLACPCLGTRRVEVTRWSGSVSSCYFALAVLGSRLEEPSGSSVGLRQLPVRRRYTWGHSKRGLVGSCSLLVHLSMNDHF